MFGKPTYFDISVRNSFTPFHIIHLSEKTGAADEDGKSEVDEHCNINASGSKRLFYPLVVELYGVWSAHSLEVLKTIAKKLP